MPGSTDDSSRRLLFVVFCLVGTEEAGRDRATAWHRHFCMVTSCASVHNRRKLIKCRVSDISDRLLFTVFCLVSSFGASEMFDGRDTVPFYV